MASLLAQIVTGHSSAREKLVNKETALCVQVSCLPLRGRCMHFCCNLNACFHNSVVEHMLRIQGVPGSNPGGIW